MSIKKSSLRVRSKGSERRSSLPPKLIYKSIRTTIAVPTTVYRVYNHPLIGFSPDELAHVVENASDRDLGNVPLLDLNRFETRKATISVGSHFLTKYRENAERRGCSTEVLINSAMADWLGWWFRDGQPKTFQEICKRIAIDCFMNSAEDELLYLYFSGVFGPPAELRDENYSSEGPLPKWVLEMQAKYKDA